MQEVVAINWRVHDGAVGQCYGLAADDRGCDGALHFQRRCGVERCVMSISCNEVDQRSRVLQIVAEIVPAFVRAQALIMGRAEDLSAQQIERRNAGFAAACDVKRGEVERLAQEVIAQCAGNELVDFVAGLMRRALNDFCRGRRAVAGVREWIGEGLDKTNTVLDRFAIGIELRRAIRVQFIARHLLIEHRVTETINGMGKFGEDARVKRDIVVAEDVNVWRDLARELFENEMLILRLGAELGGLEKALAVPFVVGNLMTRDQGDRARQNPILSKRDVAVVEFVLDQRFGFGGQAVVFGVEDLVNGREADVLVQATIAGNIVRVEQFIVVNSILTLSIRYDGIACNVVQIGGERRTEIVERVSVVGDVVQELRASANGCHRVGVADLSGDRIWRSVEIDREVPSVCLNEHRRFGDCRHTRDHY